MVVVLLLAACAGRERDPFVEAVDRLSAELGEKVIVDHCPTQALETKAVCAAHLANGAAFELEAERAGAQLHLRVAGMATGRVAAAELRKVFARRGLELPDMRCPIFIPIRAGRSVVCIGTVSGVPVVATTTATDRRFSFELKHGVISGTGMAKTIADTGLAGPGPADVDCDFDLRLSVPGSEIECGVAPRDGSPARVVKVRVEDTDGHVVMRDRDAQRQRID